MTTRIGDATRARIVAAWPEILRAFGAGELVNHVLARLDLTADELRAYRGETQGAQAEWERAREQSGDAFAERAIEMALNPVQVIPPDAPGKEPLIVRLDPAHARNAIDTLKWAARIRNPRLYSDKAQLDVNVRTVDLTRIIRDANARLAAAGQVGRIIDAEIVRHALPAPAELADLL